MSVLAGVALVTLSWCLFVEIKNIKELIVSVQEKINAYATRAAAAGAELTDSFVKLSDEFKSLKDQIAATPAAEVVDYTALDAALAGVESAAVALNGLEPPVVEGVPVEPAPVEPVAEVPAEETPAE